MARTFQVTFDCAQPAALSSFWADVLGYRPADPPEGFDSWEQWLEKMNVPEEEWDEGAWITDPDGRGSPIYFQQVPEPKRTKNRLHLDIDVSDRHRVPLDRRKEQVDAEVQRVLALGAKHLAAYEQGDHYHVVMQDPEGNEFCMR
jgi:catechol 2,3-dioxygenase-like lactoylglutathione lyase family enzyme